LILSNSNEIVPSKEKKNYYKRIIVYDKIFFLLSIYQNTF